jgi:alpha-amylase/alpha-mannosidase (GH57 family)
MEGKERLPVVLLWHMHQPQYKDAITGEYTLPWTYLHAIKDYTDMAAHLEDNPQACAVVNFTPVLIEQLEELAARVSAHLAQGTPLPDPVLALLSPAPLPTAPEERLRLLRACLRAQREHLIERFPPYLELVQLAETFNTPERVAYASDQYLRDLAVWYHLAWLGETVRRTEPLAERLGNRERDFTDAERRELLALIGRLLAQVLPRYRELAAHGRCELSVTPYAHPIIPLLIDFASAREALPNLPLPRHAGYPGGAARADWHVAEAVRLFTRVFGERPRGCWPAEGAVSEATLALLAEHGFEWAASGEGVLRGSLELSGVTPEHGTPPSGALDRPYRLGGAGVDCFFRNDVLSDLIGFTYATWHGDDAASNLVNELARLADSYPPGEHAVLVALDGENAWEHYPFNGYYFLRALYAKLSEHPRLELTTLARCRARGPAARPLKRLRAGSWVHGTLATWMGDADKNQAWDLLCEAKETFDRVLAGASLDLAQLEAAGRQLALCESSDWFWWFGDYNPAEAVRQFDELYRRQLTALYERLQLPAPARLAQPISTGGGTAEHGGTMRRATV